MAEPKFKHISLGQDHSLWAAGKADGTVYRLYGDAGVLGWVPDKIGKADILAAVDFGSTWCVNHKHEIWFLNEAYNLSEGGTWVQIPTYSGKNDANLVVTAKGDITWYVDKHGATFRAPRPGEGVGLGPWLPYNADDAPKTIAMAAHSVDDQWHISDKGELWRWQHNAWSKIPTYSGQHDARGISVAEDGSVWYINTKGELFRTSRPSDGTPNMWVHDTASGGNKVGRIDVVAASAVDDVTCLNHEGEVWRAYQGTWQQIVQIGPEGKNWVYKVKPGDNLLAIVRREFHMKEPKDTQEINRMVDMIVAQNPDITRDRILAGATLSLTY